MACFAKLNNSNVVERVESVVDAAILDKNGIESEAVGIAFLKDLYGHATNWKKSSYNTNKNIHKLGGTPFRKNHAVIGYTYDEGRDAFIPPKPYPSWILNEETCWWEAPVKRPEVSGTTYIWKEDNLAWEQWIPTT